MFVNFDTTCKVFSDLCFKDIFMAPDDVVIEHKTPGGNFVLITSDVESYFEQTGLLLVRSEVKFTTLVNST